MPCCSDHFTFFDWVRVSISLGERERDTNGGRPWQRNEWQRMERQRERERTGTYKVEREREREREQGEDIRWRREREREICCMGLYVHTVNVHIR